MNKSEKQYRDAGMDDKSIIHLLSQENTTLVAYKEKHELEFTRYKQDCRKRALDLAVEQLGKYTGKVWSDEQLIEQADKYYNWLITIPA